MEILSFPHPILLKKTEPVTVFDKELKVILDAMYSTMTSSDGIGLAAPQVGISRSFFVMNTSSGERLNIVNPRILSASKAKTSIKEGCLSAKGDFLIVPDRAEWIHVEYQNEHGTVIKKMLDKLDSVVFQHEFLHLEGKAFFQNTSIPKEIRKKISKKWGLKP